MLEKPWSIEDTCENFRVIKELMKKKVRHTNLDGKGKSDEEEVVFDFDRAIKALEKQVQLRKWIEQVSLMDIEFNSAELASVLKDFLVD